MIDIYSDEWKKLPLRDKLKAALEMPPLDPWRRIRKKPKLSPRSAKFIMDTLPIIFKEIESKKK